MCINVLTLSPPLLAISDFWIAMAPLASPEVHESDRKPNWNVMRTFDLTLHFDDETLGHDETGCYLCLLGCRKPLYQAGQVVAGHMVIRPVRNIHISGW